MRTKIATAAALVALAGCGDRASPELGAALARLGEALTPSAETLPLSATLTPDVAAAIDGPLLFARVPESGAEAGLTLLRENGDERIWVTQDGRTLTFRAGVLVATRGLGRDLMSADLGEVRAALDGGAARATRVHRYLDGEGHEVIRAYVCDYARRDGTAETLFGSSPATRIDETCHGLHQDFANVYWIDRAGQMRAARHWVGPEVGPLETQLVKDR